MLLEYIRSPQDVKRIPAEQIPALAKELREELIQVVSENGGHLASNLGVVELTIALHRVFDCPQDSLIFDVGHQSYVHKLLTGRQERFHTLRQYGGISGFPRIDESPYDAFGCGHSSTSISAAIGIATANRLAGKKDFTVAVIGDGSFTGGLAYEALNNCAENDRLIIILNDNTMSIARNVGAMDTYLNRFRNSAKYFRMKNRVKRAFQRIPFCGKRLVAFVKRLKKRVRHLLVHENFFEHLGLAYYGPLNGNDEALLETVLREAKNDGRCSVVHICTKKGKGYSFAEERPDLFHGIGTFDPETGLPRSVAKTCFSNEFGSALCELAEKDPSICAISAAMPDGTGLSKFQKAFPDRFFDVGIAEAHAVTFACGLAAKGMKPVFAVYSTFAQRAYDQLIHDCALQKLPLVLALDRAGLVGADGATHHGLFDVSFLNELPGFTVFAPDSYAELRECLSEAFALHAPVAIRYPKGSESEYERDSFTAFDGFQTRSFGEQPSVVLFTYGRLTVNALRASELLAKRGVAVCLIRLVRLKPLRAEAFADLLRTARTLYFLEEGVQAGGASEHLLALLAQAGMTDGKQSRIRAIDERFPPHGSNEELFREASFLPEQIADEIERMEHALAD